MIIASRTTSGGGPWRVGLVLLSELWAVKLFQGGLHAPQPSLWKDSFRALFPGKFSSFLQGSPSRVFLLLLGPSLGFLPVKKFLSCKDRDFSFLEVLLFWPGCCQEIRGHSYSPSFSCTVWVPFQGSGGIFLVSLEIP